MRPITALVAILALALPAPAQDTASASNAAEEVAFAPVDVGQLTLGEFQWLNRVVVVFADTPRDPSFVRQMDLLRTRSDALAERDIVVLTDTDPAGRSPIRVALRPRGFAMVIVDKDGEVLLRKPSPWDAREISRAIDTTPVRQQELREQRAQGAAARDLTR
jgi:hypothetical protein